ncbi:fimbria/pilus outer membrane usher protein [Providencia sp. DFU6]|uniref:fimbria/pilus outer membrane usher protein n=1 Tax=Providencia TaxID=586 RepID=UPI0034E57504
MKIKGGGNTGSVNASYSGSKGSVSAGYSYSKDNRSMNASVSGGALIHSGGVLLGRPVSSSMAIIEADGAAGAEVGSKDTVINSSGYALYPYTSPYNANIINMDVNTLPNDVMLKETSKTIYPTEGSIVKVKFDTKLGLQAIINLKTPSGTPIPFGAVAVLEELNVTDVNTGIVGDNNQVFMSGLPANGKLNVSWGSNNSQRCTATFSGLDTLKVSQSQPVRTISAVCQ